MLKMKALRLVLSMTQADVCKAIGVSKPTLIAWESGRKAPDREQLEALSKLYSYPANKLLRDNAKVR